MPSNDSVKIILARHGSTKLNSGTDGQTGSSEILRGHIDVPLSDKGRREADALAQKLKGHDFDVILCSDLQRAVDTAKAISKATGVPIAGATRGLRPWDVGSYAGRTLQNTPEMLVDYAANRPADPIGGGESLDQFRDRVFSCIDGIRRQYAGQTACIVSHHRCERLLQAWLETGGSLDESIDAKAFLRPGIPPGVSGPTSHSARARARSKR